MTEMVRKLDCAMAVDKLRAASSIRSGLGTFDAGINYIDLIVGWMLNSETLDVCGHEAAGLVNSNRSPNRPGLVEDGHDPRAGRRAVRPHGGEGVAVTS